MRYLIAVSLLFFLTFIACKHKKDADNVTITVKPSVLQLYGDKVPGMRKWRRYYHLQSGSVDSTHVMPDTTFEVVKVDDTTLKIFDYFFRYYPHTGVIYPGWISTVDTNNELFYIATNYGSAHSSASLLYHFKTDSLFLHFTNGGLGGSYTTYYQCP